MKLSEVKIVADAWVYLNDHPWIEYVFNSGPWAVWMLCPEGNWARVARFWTIRGARHMRNELSVTAPHVRLEVHSWWWT